MPNYITYKQEIWADIPGYEGAYQVSDFGDVRSLDRVVNHKRWGTMKRKGKMLKQVKNSDGYPGVYLYRDGEMTRQPVHRLVAELFCEKTGDDLEVNHRNENKEDNRASNLEWITHADNVRYGTGNPRRAKSLSIPVIATREDGTELRFESCADAARTLGILRGEISRCCRGIYKSYKCMKWRYAEEV